MGAILANFQSGGIIRDINERLNKWVRLVHISEDDSLNNLQSNFNTSLLLAESNASMSFLTLFSSMIWKSKECTKGGFFHLNSPPFPSLAVTLCPVVLKKIMKFRSRYVTFPGIIVLIFSHQFVYFLPHWFWISLVTDNGIFIILLFFKLDSIINLIS